MDLSEQHRFYLSEVLLEFMIYPRKVGHQAHTMMIQKRQLCLKLPIALCCLRVRFSDVGSSDFDDLRGRLFVA